MALDRAALKIVSPEIADNREAVSILEEALAKTSDPAEGVTAALVMLFRPDGTFNMVWSAGGNVSARIGALERAKYDLIRSLNE